MRELEQSNVSLMSDQSDKFVKKASTFSPDMDLSQMVKSKFGGSGGGGGANSSSNIAS